jgi:hypothetical protein
MYYVLSTTYAWFLPKHQDKTSGLRDSSQEKKGGTRRGETQETTSGSEINTLRHTYPFLLYAIACHFPHPTVKLPSSVLPPPFTYMDLAI